MSMPKWYAKFFICFLVFLGLMACEPSRRIQRICRNHPEACVLDSTKKKITDTIPGIDAEFTFDLDSIPSAPVVTKPLYNPNIQYIGPEIVQPVNRPHPHRCSPLIIKDTLAKVIDGITIKLFQSGKSIGVKVHKPVEVRQKEITVQNGVKLENKCYHEATNFDIFCYALFGLNCIYLIIWVINKFYGR